MFVDNINTLYTTKLNNLELTKKNEWIFKDIHFTIRKKVNNWWMLKLMRQNEYQLDIDRHWW